ncbi:EhaF family protein [Methanothermobacter wolfeii]|uniref:EhaF family protein n=1 Tax=Methanothermobacter wolfeii TaxID=145261 RepID=A0A9E7RVQ4_METWO|nr:MULTISPECIES: EhaF family protein [Methanothermobacter]MDI6701640.1 EhaF family protein [Methanothermobacter wolfeii]NLM02160.1 EhaF family protein [Methanothermobacter wolfeii]QHN06264.1 DUF2106 domain-containing protein [Methanothermobacter sp. THM-1]UXH32460.1 EhaF family protein [Methanothermobacter wolfeii]SCM56919.1 putative protein MJ0524 [Methanothermobacter wolfeii]
MNLGRILNELANPKRIPRIFAVTLGLLLLVGFLVPMSLNENQLYPRPAPQEQINSGDPLAPYDRGGEPLKEPADVKSQYPAFEVNLGKITAYLSPLAIVIRDLTVYFGTSIYSSPGGLIDEILYYTRGLDTVLESSILMMAFTIASWVAINFTARRRRKP